MYWIEHGEHMSTGGWVFMGLGMLVLIVLVVVLVVWLVSQQRSSAGPPPGRSARETLDHRLVSGEITPDQYDELRQKLDPGAAAPAGPPAGSG